jgi:hypothetical protein
MTLGERLVKPGVRIERSVHGIVLISRQRSGGSPPGAPDRLAVGATSGPAPASAPRALPTAADVSLVSGAPPLSPSRSARLPARRCSFRQPGGACSCFTTALGARAPRSIVNSVRSRTKRGRHGEPIHRARRKLPLAVAAKRRDRCSARLWLQPAERSTGATKAAAEIVAAGENGSVAHAAYLLARLERLVIHPRRAWVAWCRKKAVCVGLRRTPFDPNRRRL